MRCHIALISVVLLAGCSHIPRAGYDSVVIEPLRIDFTLVQASGMEQNVLALSGAIHQGTLAKLRNSTIQVVPVCKGKAVKLQGALKSVSGSFSVGVPAFRWGSFDTKTDYRVAIDASLVDCDTGKVIGTLEKSSKDEHLDDIVGRLSNELADFVLYQ